jgi:ADP-heptose:LPS heptosyltransferase
VFPTEPPEITVSNTHNILFVELLGGLGDVLIALGAIQALARSHPQARLTALTFPPGGELLERDPLIYEVAYAPKPDTAHPHGAREAVEKLVTQRSWELIVSDTSYDSIDELIAASGVPHVVTNLWRSPPADERVGERFLRLILAEGLIDRNAISPPLLYLTAEERSSAAERLAGTRCPLAFLIPDAGMDVKRWPEERWAALGRALRDSYAADVVVPVGSDPEQATRIASLVEEGVRVWPRGTLRELAAALSHADLVVGADTGPTRIATALRVPTVTLFGPSWYGRYGQPPPHINLQGHPSCPQRLVSDFTQQPCWYGGACTLEDRSWLTCLEDISVGEVLVAAASLLKNGSDPETAPHAANLDGGLW